MNAYQIDLTPDTLLDVIVLIAFAFFAMGLLLMMTLYALRIIKSARKKKELRIREQCQRIVNTIIINDTASSKSNPSPALLFQIAQLKQIIGSSAFGKNIFIRQLLDIKRNLSGASAHAIENIYGQLGLEVHSKAKLRSWRWELVGQGIRELGEMRCTSAIELIKRFVNSRNQVLRQESFMALVRLQSAERFSFLDDYRESITPWMTLNIYAFLQNIDSRQLPDFTRWFNHTNQSVRYFSLQMAKQFRDTKALNSVATLVNDQQEELAVLAIDTLREMEAFEYSVSLLPLLQAPNTKKSLAAIRALGKIGEPAATAQALMPLLNHPAYEIRFETVNALLQLGEPGLTAMSVYQESSQPIVKHLQEPLLQ